MTDFEPLEGSGGLWSAEAERAVLGAMIMSPRVIGEIAEAVEAHDFREPRNELIFTTIMEMYAGNQPVDAVTLGSRLGKELNRHGGLAYLHDLMNAVPTAANGAYYAEIVARLAVKRRMVEAGTRIRQMGLDTDSDDMAEILGTAFEELRKVQPGRDPGPESVAETLAYVLDTMEEPNTEDLYHTGVTALDDVYRGAAPGRVDVIAGRPAQGKSVMAINFIRANTLRRQVPTDLYALEMSAAENVSRILSAEAKVGLHRIVDPEKHPLEDSDWARVAQVTAALMAMPLRIYDTPVNLMHIAKNTREGVRDRGLKLVIVDYLQLMQNTGRPESRQVAVSQNIDGLKHIAKENNVAVVCLAQLNRNSTGRMDRKPLLSDLRESGAIEQTADCVILIYRPDQEEPESPRAGEADLIVAKQRNGATGTATCVFQGHYARFIDFGA